jgi:hypothetical protein
MLDMTLVDPKGIGLVDSSNNAREIPVYLILFFLIKETREILSGRDHGPRLMQCMQFDAIQSSGQTYPILCLQLIQSFLYK